MLRENSKSNAIKLPINRGFSYEEEKKKEERNLERKTLLILPKQRVISKSKRAPLLPQKSSSFLLFQIKVGIFLQFNLRSSQRPSHQIKYVQLLIQLGGMKARFKIKLHSPSDHKVSWRSNQRSLLYSFICKESHRKLYSHIYKSI